MVAKPGVFTKPDASEIVPLTKQYQQGGDNQSGGATKSLGECQQPMATDFTETYWHHTSSSHIGDQEHCLRRKP